MLTMMSMWALLMKTITKLKGNIETEQEGQNINIREIKTNDR